MRLVAKWIAVGSVASLPLLALGRASSSFARDFVAVAERAPAPRAPAPLDAPDGGAAVAELVVR